AGARATSRTERRSFAPFVAIGPTLRSQAGSKLGFCFEQNFQNIAPIVFAHLGVRPGPILACENRSQTPPQECLHFYRKRIEPSRVDEETAGITKKAFLQIKLPQRTSFGIDWAEALEFREKSRGALNGPFEWCFIAKEHVFEQRLAGHCSALARPLRV